MVRKTGMNKKYLPDEQERQVAKQITYIEDTKGIFNHDDKLFPVPECLIENHHHQR